MSYTRIAVGLSSITDAVEDCRNVIPVVKKTAESIAKLSDEIKDGATTVIKSIEHVGSNVTALHRRGRLLLFPLPSLGGLTLAEAKVCIPELTKDEVKEMRSIYLAGKDRWYKLNIAASKLSKDVLVNALRLDVNDKTRAEMILEYTLNPTIEGSDLNRVCRNYLLEKKLNGVPKEEKQQSLTCGKR